MDGSSVSVGQCRDHISHYKEKDVEPGHISTNDKQGETGSGFFCGPLEGSQKQFNESGCMDG